MQTTHALYVIDDDRVRLDFARMTSWLTTTYWSPDIPASMVERGFTHSALVLGAYLDDEQVGCLRVISDLTRFAYIADVFVDPNHRGRGLGRAMTTAAVDHPDTRLVYQWLLGTMDAQGVYAACGFEPLPNPERYMRLKRPMSWYRESQP